MPDIEELNQIRLRIHAAEMRIKGAQKEFLAAIVMNDEKEMESLRERMHSLLDGALDGLVEMGRKGGVMALKD